MLRCNTSGFPLKLRDSGLYENEELCGVEGVDPNILSFIILLNIKYNLRYHLTLGENFESYNIIYYIILIFIKMVTRERRQPFLNYSIMLKGV
jgi:hypothetical protein